MPSSLSLQVNTTIHTALATKKYQVKVQPNYKIKRNATCDSKLQEMPSVTNQLDQSKGEIRARRPGITVNICQVVTTPLDCLPCYSQMFAKSGKVRDLVTFAAWLLLVTICLMFVPLVLVCLAFVCLFVKLGGVTNLKIYRPLWLVCVVLKCGIWICFVWCRWQFSLCIDWKFRKSLSCLHS